MCVCGGGDVITSEEGGKMKIEYIKKEHAVIRESVV